jgi:hypothetical protein
MKRKFAWVAHLILALAIVLPIVSLHTLPFTDLPIHLAEATILKYRDNPTSPLSHSFSASRLSWFQPAIGTAVFCSWFSSVETGNLALYVAYCFAIPFSMLYITRMCGGNLVVSLLSILTIWNYNALWGFTGFTLGIPLVLLSVSQGIQCITSRSWAHPVVLGVLFVFIYWMHVLLFMFAMFVFILITLMALISNKSDNARQILGRSISSMIPAAGLLVLWILKGSEFKSGDTATFLWDYYLNSYIHKVSSRFLPFIFDNWQDIAYGKTGRAISIFFAMALITPAVICLCRLLRQKLPLTTARMSTLAFLGASIFCFVALPDGLPGQPFLYQRFSVFCYLAIISVLSWTFPNHYSTVKTHMMIFLLIIGYVVLWGHYFASFRSADQEFVRFHQNMPNTGDHPIGYLICDPGIRGRPALVHYNNYDIIWSHKPTLTSVGRYRFGMIEQVPSIPVYIEYLHKKWLKIILLTIDKYKECNYLVVQGKDAIEFVKHCNDLSPVYEYGQWCLFKRHDVANRLPENMARKLTDPQY